MTIKQIEKLGVEVALKFANVESVKRGDVIREVVRTKKLSLEDSIILADCIVKGLAQSGKAVVIPDCCCFPDGTYNIDCPTHQHGIRAAFGAVGL